MRDDSEVIQDLAIVAPLVLIKIQRVMLAVRLACKAPAHLILTLLATAENKRSWIQTCWGILHG